MAYQSAQGLASLGRNGDSMLVHMSPTEVAGLQSLAMARGGSLTVNPDTGMPEAFNLGGVFKAALPMIAGAALGPAGFGLTGLQAGLLVGGATALLSGDIGQGIMAGFGAGAGSSLGQSLSDFAKRGAASNVPTGEFMGDVIQKQVASTNTALPTNTFGAANTGGFGAATKGFSPATISGQGSFLGSGVGNTPISGVNLNPTASFAKPVINAPAMPTQSLVPELTSGVNKINLANTSNLIRPEAGAGSMLSGAGRAFKNPGEFVDFMGGGYETAKQVGLPVAGMIAGGVEESDLYPKQQAYAEAPSNAVDPLTGRLRLKYDTGLRLNPTYAKEGGYINGYATGGTIQSGGIRDLYGTPDNQPTISPGLSGFGLGRLNNLAGEQAMTKAQTLGYAEGGDISNYRQDQAGLNLNELPSLNTVTGEQIPAGGNDMYSFNDKAAFSPVGRMLLSKMPQSDRAKFIGSGMGTFFGLQQRPKQDYYTSSGALTSSYAQGGLTAFAMGGNPKGGYLNGQGDGMSDSIPATIEGKQPARLADGEFVVPADVVSHLGNGSSKAGSKKLYAMMDKVRHARTGNKKQGRQINPDKYLPKLA
jgi:hypothetical protein